jgi:hypothetical protein
VKAIPIAVGTFFVITYREASREEKNGITAKISVPFAQIGFHADVILQSQEKVKAPKEKTGVPCLSCAQRGSGLTNEDALALWIRKAQTGLKLQIFQGQEAHRTQDIPFLTIRCADMDTEFRHLTEWAPLS